ncbi:MAG TPA: class I tRNA ligase family protein, partial [Rhizomicrobium sp.]|nr:class I tRNA ligase family protein [Rhizomicrobium sp.]
SLGNTLAPQVIAEKNGAEILRLWAASSDFTEDLRIGQDIIKANVEAYRRLRNTIRFMLANLAGFSEQERISYGEMPELEKYALALLAKVDGQVRGAYEDFDFGRVHSVLFNFCTNDLSSFYFDVRKDSLYCDSLTSVRRRSVRTVIDNIFRRVVTWYAPILCFTMEEAWLARFTGDDESVHLQTFFDVPPEWFSVGLIERWGNIRQIRRVVTGALEIARADKKIGSSLEASPRIYIEGGFKKEFFDSLDLAEACITSTVKLEYAGRPVDRPENNFSLPDVPNIFVVFGSATGTKCARCWRVLEETRADTHLCNRCSGAVAALEPA